MRREGKVPVLLGHDLAPNARLFPRHAKQVWRGGKEKKAQVLNSKMAPGRVKELPSNSCNKEQKRKRGGKATYLFVLLPRRCMNR